MQLQFFSSVDSFVRKQSPTPEPASARYNRDIWKGCLTGLYRVFSGELQPVPPGLSSPGVEMEGTAPLGLFSPAIPPCELRCISLTLTCFITRTSIPRTVHCQGVRLKCGCLASLGKLSLPSVWQECQMPQRTGPLQLSGWHCFTHSCSG